MRCISTLNVKIKKIQTPPAPGINPSLTSGNPNLMLGELTEIQIKLKKQKQTYNHKLLLIQDHLQDKFPVLLTKKEFTLIKATVTHFNFLILLKIA
jgi:hypothetical protein